MKMYVLFCFVCVLVFFFGVSVGTINIVKGDFLGFFVCRYFCVLQ